MQNGGKPCILVPVMEMEKTELTCPGCSAPRRVNAAQTQAICEFCGRSTLLRDPARETEQNQTQKLIRKLREERENAPPPAADDGADTLRGMLLSFLALRIPRLRMELRDLLCGAIFLICAVGSYFLLKRFLPPDYLSYVPIPAGVLALAGLFCMFVSWRSVRSIPLGVGIGALVYWLLENTGKKTNQNGPYRSDLFLILKIRLFFLGCLGLRLFRKAIAAERIGLVAKRSGDPVGLAASGADDVDHLTIGFTGRFSRRTASLATLGLVLKALQRIELLFACCKDELVSTLFTDECFVFIHRFLPRSNYFCLIPTTGKTE